MYKVELLTLNDDVVVFQGSFECACNKAHAYKKHIKMLFGVVDVIVMRV